MLNRASLYVIALNNNGGPIVYHFHTTFKKSIIRQGRFCRDIMSSDQFKKHSCRDIMSSDRFKKHSLTNTVHFCSPSNGGNRKVDSPIIDTALRPH